MNPSQKMYLSARRAGKTMLAMEDLQRAVAGLSRENAALRTELSKLRNAPAGDPAATRDLAALYELLGATSQFEATHLINELVADKIDDTMGAGLLAMFNALGVRNQDEAMAKIKELTK